MNRHNDSSAHSHWGDRFIDNNVQLGAYNLLLSVAFRFGAIQVGRVCTTTPAALNHSPARWRWWIRSKHTEMAKNQQ